MEDGLEATGEGRGEVVVRVMDEKMDVATLRQPAVNKSRPGVQRGVVFPHFRVADKAHERPRTDRGGAPRDRIVEMAVGADRLHDDDRVGGVLCGASPRAGAGVQLRGRNPMNDTWQTITALGLAGVALGYLLWRGLRRRGASPCADGGCGCDKGGLKPRVK